MLSKDVLIQNATGVHARPAAQFVKTATQFKSNIKISKDGKDANGKSMINILSLNLTKGSTMTISAEGVDEKDAVEALVNLVESKFDEN